MLNFSPSFFEDETRDGFLVSEEMKRYWAATMETLMVLAEICGRHHLQWYVDMGSMLGAVRHQGFVPWDDDIDIGLKRADYQVLMNVLPKELPRTFGLGGPFFGEAYEDFFVGVSNCGHPTLDKGHLERYHGCPYRATIDIFPMDTIPSNPEEAKGLEALMRLIFSTQGALRRGDFEEMEEGLQALEEVTGTHFDRTADLQSQIWMLAHLLASSYGEKDGDYLVEWVAYLGDPNKIYHKSWYRGTIELPFENITVPVPVGYDRILTTRYGDYMVPVMGAAAHDYPHYLPQKEELKKLQS